MKQQRPAGQQLLGVHHYMLAASETGVQRRLRACSRYGQTALRELT